MRPSTPIIIKHLQKLPEGSKLLDVGCGKGRDLKRMVTACPHIDFYATDWEDTGLLPQEVKFVEGDIREVEMMFPNTVFDVIVCQHVLEHMVYPVEIMRSFNKLLGKKGRVFVESPNWTRLWIPFHSAYFFNDPTHIKPFTKKSYGAMCRESGFTVVTIKAQTSPEPFSLKGILSATGVFSFMKRVIAFIVDPFLKLNLILVAKKHEQ